MTYGAITVDTSVFTENGDRLNSGLIAQLTQFKGKPAGMVLSEIVIRELHNHLTDRTQLSINNLEKCLRQHRELQIATDDTVSEALQHLSPDASPSDIAEAVIDRFINSTSSTLVAVTETTDFRELVRRYFDQDPPFGAGKKKHEFPDAMALLSLEAWANNNGIRLLAVSTDSDWKAFAEASEYIDCESDLASALELFQPDTTSKEFCKQLAEILAEQPEALISEEVLNRVAEEVAEASFLTEIEGPFPVIEDYVELVVDAVEYNNDASIVPVQAQEEALALRATFLVAGEAHGSFEFEIKDSIDRDYVPVIVKIDVA